MKSLIKLLIITIIFSTSIFSQGTAGTSAKYEFRSLVDLPSAGVLEKGFVGVSMNLLPKGVVISNLEVGVFDNFSFGFSYGGSNVIGSGKIDWYKLPGFNARLRVLDETESIPAITVGFDSQGKGDYFDDEKRYEIKSPGFFAAAAKNFDFLGYLSLHAIVNYSLEREDGDKDLNFAIGIEKTIGSTVTVLAEYDVAINDNHGLAFGDGKGYLNMGIRWSVGEGFTIGLDLRDLLDNKKFNSNKADRGIFVEYIKGIF